MTSKDGRDIESHLATNNTCLFHKLQSRLSIDNSRSIEKNISIEKVSGQPTSLGGIYLCI
jgi:hypothetical protein